MTKRLFITITVVIAIIGGGVFLYFQLFGHQEHGQGNTQLYTCPMHPQVVKDEPGDCPICFMKLVPVKMDEPAQDEHSGHAKQLYTCPMHPQIVKDEPGDCPICFMKLVPVKMDEPMAEQTGHQKKTMYRSSMNPNEISDKPGKDSMGMEMIPFETEEEGEVQTPAGLAAVTVPKAKQALIGLTFGTAETKNIAREIRTSARIVPDETRLFRITMKVDGWIERLYVNQTGQYVKKGEPLLAIYSPELVAAQQEFLSSLSADTTVGAGFDVLKTAAAERLRLFDINEAQIERLRTGGKVERTLTIASPVSGYVTEKMALQGTRVMMNEPLMTIADLSHVWGEADIYETDMPFVQVGMPAELTLSYWPGKSFPGRISFLYPFLETETRTIKARIEISNPQLLLKPGMYADAKLAYDLGERLAVPEGAVMRTGVMDYVFVEKENDRIVPVEVELGVRSGDGYYEIISGLAAGDRVVTSGNFLIDSESSLKAALKSAASAGTHQH